MDTQHLLALNTFARPPSCVNGKNLVKVRPSDKQVRGYGVVWKGCRRLWSEEGCGNVNIPLVFP
jgi:hypothetical protein